MPTTGPYEFHLAPKAVNAVVSDNPDLIDCGEWSWVDRTSDYGWLLIARCPDCGGMITLWSHDRGHNIDDQGNVTPSVLHSYKVDMKERCGFHTMPTKLLDFREVRE